MIEGGQLIGGGSGVTSLNLLTGALALIAGTNITLEVGSSTITINATDAAGITSINGDTTPAQVIAGGDGITIDSVTTPGTTVISTTVSAVPSSRTILPIDETTSGMITGGGDLTADRTFDTANFVKGSVGTGLISGGVIAMVDGSNFSITDGVGLIIDNENDPLNPVITYVTIPAATIAKEPSSATRVYVFYDGSDISQSDIPLTNEELRKSIYLGYLNCYNGITISLVVAAPCEQFNLSVQMQASSNALGLINVGNYVTPSADITTTLTWTWISGANIPDQLGTYGTMGTPSLSNIPGARMGSSIAVDADNLVWLFGGYGNNLTSLQNQQDLWTFNQSTLAWAWIKGSSTGAGPFYGTYGTKGTPDPANIPGGRQYGFSWVDKYNQMWLVGGQYSAGEDNFLLNDVWLYQKIDNNYTWMGGSNTTNQPGNYGIKGIPSVDNIPGSRNKFSAQVLDKNGDGKLLLFGGSGFDSTGVMSRLNDLWIFDPYESDWKWILGSKTVDQLGSYGTIGVPDPTNIPGARYAAYSWLDADGNFWLFGGFGCDHTSVGDLLLNDIWRLNLTTLIWTWMGGSNVGNQPGNYGTMGVPDPANIPGGRGLGNAWLDADGNFCLFGGFGLNSAGASKDLNDVWVFNPSTKLWAWTNGSNVGNQPATYGTKGTPDPANTPGGRSGGSSWTDTNSKMYLFGGQSILGGNLFNDLWKFDSISTDLLNLDLTGGSLVGTGINYANNIADPNSLTIPSLTTIGFRVATINTIGGSVSVLPVSFYDVGGVATAVPTGESQNMRVYLQSFGTLMIQYGQVTYASVAEAKAAITSEAFTPNPINLQPNAICIGVISVVESAVDLSDTNQALFTRISKLGDSIAMQV
jgi:N-acetylneuraminic acid mutarotase